MFAEVFITDDGATKFIASSLHLEATLKVQVMFELVVKKGRLPF